MIPSGDILACSMLNSEKERERWCELSKLMVKRIYYTKTMGCDERDEPILLFPDDDDDDDDDGHTCILCILRTRLAGLLKNCTRVLGYFV